MEPQINKLCDESFFHDIARSFCHSYRSGHGVSLNAHNGIPQREAVIAALEMMLELLFPGYSGRHDFSESSQFFSVGALLDKLNRYLVEQIQRSCAYCCEIQHCAGDCANSCFQVAQDSSHKLLSMLPELRETLLLDVQAALDGDPATSSPDEVIIAYPGFKAICIHRIANVLYREKIPLIPRIMSEYAHTSTGIDINPGASIGKSFFIDHGTGVVIGETAVIGDHVKLYQGVTLGALSFPKDSGGNLIKGHKRHPNIEDHVTIYAGATILGDISIGHHSTIGGNVWLTESLEPYSKVTFTAPQASIKVRKKK
ncbi:MAG: serine O-acetyltransferase EpsC [Lentisphaeria bacterium]|jgi:serine O-acetyltransferase|nr:serine O-acetyltransferase EpsC [Lentisphaeria bacterium]